MSASRNACPEGVAELAASLRGAAASDSHAAATVALRVGLAQLLSEAKRLRNVAPNFVKGNLFEQIEALKFNSDAARQGSRVRAEVTATLGYPTAAADILLVKQGEVVQAVQAKVSSNSTYLSEVLSDPKYGEMQKLVPRERAGQVHQLSRGRAELFSEQGDPRASEFADTANNVTGELQFGRVRSGGTTVEEALEAAIDPVGYANRLELEALLLEALVAAEAGAKAGAILGGAFSVLNGSLRLARAETTIEEVLVLGANDAARSALRSGATGVVVPSPIWPRALQRAMSRRLGTWPGC